jgi:hypothetical protein
MKVFRLAAGLAVGYVLGARAGREKYDQIAAAARKLANHPTVVDAQAKIKGLVDTGTQTVTAKVAETADTVTEKMTAPRTRTGGTSATAATPISAPSGPATAPHQ